MYPALQVGSDDDGYAVRMRLRHYLRYCAEGGPDGAASDDSPLYIFDGTFADRAGSAAMRADYEVPPHFAEDLMHYAGARRRPPYRYAVYCTCTVCCAVPLASIAPWRDHQHET